MENSYVKQFPDLMAGKKIMYVHGFMSSGKTHTVDLLRSLLPNAEVVADDIPLRPQEGMAMLKEMAERENPDLIIGTSMGGMYGEMLYGYNRILVNPAFQMGETLLKNNMLGKQEFLNPRKDGTKEVIITKALQKEYEEMTTNCFAKATKKEDARVFGMFGDSDPIVHTYDLFRQHYSQAIHFHGAHALTEKVLLHYISPVIRWIDDRQQGRERPVVYITFDAMHDSYGKPMSSLHKAYEMLIEHYNVYILAPAPTNDAASMLSVHDWVEDALSAPAWNHVIFSNQVQLLYGDYLISQNPSGEFLGTTIQLGSEEFKTWEEIIVFFDRLGGQ